VHPPSERSELHGVLFVERDVQPFHATSVHAKARDG
jgi:hypothetical protein